MLTEDTSIYKAVYDLFLILIDQRCKFDKNMKYIIGDKIIDLTSECLCLIHEANEDKRKGARVEHLDKFLRQFNKLKTFIMVCRDRQQFKINVLADIFIRIADIEKQLVGWRKASRKSESQSLNFNNED